MRFPHRPHPACPSPRRGAAAITAAFVLVALTGLTVAFLQIGLSFARENDSRRQDDRAIALADFGVAESVYAMRGGGTGNVGRSDTPAYCGDGLFWAEVDEVANDVRRVRSTALVESGRARVEALVFEFDDSFFGTGVFSSQSLTLSSQVFIDSFDAAAGPYATQLAASGLGYVSDDVVIQSNGDITVNSSVEIYGDTHPGPDGTVTIQSSSTVSGSEQPLPSERVLPSVTVPVVAGSGSLSAPSDGVSLASGSYNLDSLEIVSGTFTVTGPATLVLGDFELHSNTEIVFDTASGAIELYVSGTVDLASNSTITTSSQTAVDMALYLVGGPGQVVELDSNSDFYGYIYGPDATVDIASNFEVFGSVVAEQVVLASNSRIHYDESLRNLSVGLGTFVVASWTLVGLDDELRVNRTDPFRLLGVDAATLPAPGDAHDLP